MKTITKLVSEGFIWGVGITRPKPEKAQRAGLFITGLLVAGLLCVAALFLFIAHSVGR